MKKSLLTISKNFSKYAFVAVTLAVSAVSCSDDISAPDAPDDGANAAIEKATMTVTTDADYLSQYVTNYAPAARSRAGVADEVYSMPVACPTVPDEAVEYSSIDYYNFDNEWVDCPSREQAKVAKVTSPTEKPLVAFADQTIYVTSKLTIVGANSIETGGNIKIYVLPGGELVFKGNYTNGFEFPKDEKNSLTVYNFGELSAAKDDEPCKLEKLTIHSATPITIDNLAPGVSSEIYAYDGIDLVDLDVYVGATVYSSCKIIASNSIIIDSGAKVSTGYVKAPYIQLKGNDNKQKLLLRDKGYWEAGKIEINNPENTLVGSNEGSYSVIKADEILLTSKDASTTFENTYILCNNFTGSGEIKTPADVILDASVTINDTTDILLDSDDDTACAPITVRPAPSITPDGPLTLISKVEMDHRHDISATCIDVNGNQAFVSWHERGNNIQGCIEVLNINPAANTVSFQAWMETPRYINGGTENADNAYDFNHLFYDAATASIITVGDHSKKGGFVGQIKVNEALSTGAAVGENIDLLIPRQLPLAASGNAVLRHGQDLYIACAGGYSIFPFGDGSNFAYAPGGKDEFEHLNAMVSLTTKGSAKHIASNGTYIASIEYTEAKAADDDAANTELPALVTVRNANTWINNGDVVKQWTIPAFGPTNGKDVIAIDDAGNVYSCQGKNGVAKYVDGTEVARFDVDNYLNADNDFTPEEINKMRHSAANGLCIFGDYIFVANGGAGVWVLNASDLTPVAHFTDAGEYFSQELGEKIGASANYIKVTDDGYVYVAYGLAGVMVLKFDATAI